MWDNRTVGAVAIIATLSCSDPAPPDDAQIEPSLGASVEATLLTADQVTVAQPGAYKEPIISSERAIELAAGFVRQYAHFNWNALEAAHGTAIDPEHLTVQERTFFVESPYSHLDTIYSRGMQKAFGPYYIVNFYHNAVPALSIAVSAYNTDWQLINDQLIRPTHSGNDFLWLGVPDGTEYPISPERAASIAAAATGGVVVEPPALLGPPAYGGTPHYGRWRLILDRPVDLRLSGDRNVSTDTVYVDWKGRLVVPNEQERASEVFPLRYRDLSGSQRVTLPPKDGFPRHFLLVSSVR